MFPPHRPLTVLLMVSMMWGCITRPVSGEVFPDRLGEIPPETRIVAITKQGEELRLRVTRATESTIEGVDRHYRPYRLSSDELADVRIVPQNDFIVMLAFVAVVFVTGI